MPKLHNVLKRSYAKKDEQKKKYIEILSKILEALGVQVKDNSVLKEGVTNIVGLVQSRPIATADTDGSPFKSITTESVKVKNIKENFESLVEALNIKSQC
jgi:hypothetical protein